MTAIEFENISKQYRLGLVSTRTLSHDLKRWYAMNIQGKDDPYLKIGEVNDRAHRGESEYVWALKDINFKVEQGDVLGIIGKNGAGKSTLLKILSKVTTPSTGTIKARGRIASLLEVGTGFHPEMTGRENIYMNGAIMGMTKAEISRKFDEIVDFSGVERYIDTPAKRYSSGMTVRLGFAIAAHLDPEILVVDEVLAVGDAEFQKKAIGKMQDVSKGEGRTVLFVSHNMASLKNLCTNGVLLKNGYVSYSGTIHNTIDEYLKVNSNNNEIFLEKKTFKSIYKSQINSICLKDANTFSNKNVFKMGENICIDIHFKLIENFEFLNINVRMNDAIGTGIAAWRTQEMGIKLKYSKELIVRLIINDLNVFDGKYNLSVALVNGQETIDFIDQLINFEIVPNEHDLFKGKAISKSYNLIYTPCSWLQIN